MLNWKDCEYILKPPNPSKNGFKSISTFFSSGVTKIAGNSFVTSHSNSVASNTPRMKNITAAHFVGSLSPVFLTSTTIATPPSLPVRSRITVLF